MRFVLLATGLASCLGAADDGGGVASTHAVQAMVIERARDRVVPWRTWTDAVEGLAVIRLQAGSPRERRLLGIDDLIVGVDGKPPAPAAWFLLPDTVGHLEVIRASGDGARESVAMGDTQGAVVVRPWIGWCAGFRRQAGGRHPALDALAAAEVLLEDGHADAAAVEMETALRAGATGPWTQGLLAMVMHARGQHPEAVSGALAAAEGVTPLARVELLLVAARSMLLDLRFRDYKDLLERHPQLRDWALPALVPVDETASQRADAARAFEMDARRDEDQLTGNRTTTDRKGGFGLEQLIESRRIRWMISEPGNYHVVRLDTSATDGAISADLWLTPQAAVDTGWARAFFLDLKASQPPGTREFAFRMVWDGVGKRILVTAVGMKDLPLPIAWPWDGAAARRVTLSARGPRIDLAIDGRVAGRFLRPRSAAGTISWELWSEGMASALTQVSVTGHGAATVGSTAAPAPGPEAGSAGF